MSVTTANDIIKSALKRIRVLGKGDTLDDEDAQDALDILNMMLESWSLDKLYVFEEAQVNFPFVASKQDYTVGPSGDFNMPARPLRLVSAFTRSNGIDYPMHIIEAAADYDTIMNKQIVVFYPTYVWYEQTFPLGTLHFYPVPNGNYVYLRFWQQLQSFPTLTTTISLPLGYKQAIITSLGLALASPFGIEPPGTLSAEATIAVGRIKRYNKKSTGMMSEAAFMNRQNHRYNIMGDNYT